MNKVYKSVWNESLGAWVAASETAKGRSKQKAAKKGASAGMAAIAMAGAALGLQSTGASAVSVTAALFNDFKDGECTGIVDGDTHTTSDVINSRCSTGLGNQGGAASVGMMSGGAPTGLNLISNQNGLFVNGGLEIFGTGVAAGSPVAYVHGGLSLFSDGTTSSSANKLIGVAAGTAGTDAVNLSQLQPVTSAFGGNAAVNADGSVTGPSYTLKGTTYNNVGDALAAVSAASGSMYFHANSTGTDSNADGKESIAVGPSAVSYDMGSVAIGANAKTDGVVGSEPATVAGGVALGYNASEFGTGSVAIGQDSMVGANATGSEANDAVAIGRSAKAVVSGAVALGASAMANSANSVAIGNGATASVASSIALGANSVADRANSVSVGSATGMRQITNVANGTQANDAVNVTQLQNVTTLLGGGAALKADGTVTAPAYTVAGTTLSTVGAAIAQVDTELSNKVAYDSADHSKVTLGGVGSTTPVTLSNVKAGALTSTSTDAVNGSQLTATNTNVTSLQTFATNINNGGGIKFFHTNSTLADSTATGTDAVAIGGAASATATGAVALGSSSVADRANSVSVGAAGNERQITNVAAGTTTTDAVNLGQLTTVSSAVSKLGTFAVKYDMAADGTPNYNNVTLGGAGAANSTKLTNLTAATLASSSTDAVNGSQLFATNQRVGSLESFETNVNNGGGVKYFHTNSQLVDSLVSGKDSVAIGGAANATADNAVALGSSSVADRANSVSVGAAGKERQITNVAAGTTATDAVNLGQLTTVSSSVSKLGTFAVKYDMAADGTPNYNNVTLGGAGAANSTKLTNLSSATLTSSSTDAVNGSQLFATNQRVGSLETFETNINNGGGIKYFHTNSQLVDSLVSGKDSVAIGGAANATADNAVALGSNSVADRANSVSVGAAGKERQITNVAAGTASTDAVNFGQLTSVSDNVSTLDSFAVKYDKATDGTVNYQSITLGGAGATQPTLLTNLAKGALSETSSDAVNGSQLYATNQDVAALQGFTNNINNGGGIKYFHSNSTLADSSATGTNAVAIGGAATASANNAVALGANSVADRANSVSVGAVGSERQVTNVAAGTQATDAANVGQLNAVSQAVTSLGASAIKYDNNADGTPDYANATLGNGNTTGTALHNVAAGTTGMDAVNLSQMNDALGVVTNLANGAYNPMFSADGNRDTQAATSSGTLSVASGANATASGVNAVASGANALSSGANAVALGSAATASAANSVAIGANSVADRANAVSVGTTAAGGQRQITNVEAGTQGTDAVNVNQMQQSVNTGVKSAKGYTDALRSDMNSGLSMANNHINSVGAMSSAMAMMAGSAAAIADKDNRFAAGTGVYRDKAAIAVGFQRRFGNNMVLTIGGSTTGEETTGGAGFAFGF